MVTLKIFLKILIHILSYGVWVTCFVAFLQKDKDVKNFLEMWYLQTLKHTTQDQVGFPYVCQKTNMIPLHYLIMKYMEIGLTLIQSFILNTDTN